MRQYGRRAAIARGRWQTLHMLKLEDHRSIQKNGAVKTNASVFLMKHLLSGESYELTQTKTFDMR